MPPVGTMSERLKQCRSEVSIAIENDKWASISTEPDWHEEVNRWVVVLHDRLVLLSQGAVLPELLGLSLFIDEYTGGFEFMH